MKVGIHSLWREERGVSVVIGAMLMMLVVAAMWGTIQAFLVPDWNKDVEYEHLNIVHDDMMTFKSDVEDVASSGEPKSSNFRMGCCYPNRMFLANPGAGVAGSLTSDNVAVSIVYTIDTPGDPTITQTYNSNRVIYEAQGNIDSPKLVYEHGVIIRDYGNASATTDEQSLIIGDEIFIPVLTGNLTASSSMETESITLKPLSRPYSRSRIKSVTITMDTNYPAVWAQLLAGTSTVKTSVSVNQTQSKIIITSTATKQITFPAGNVTTDSLYAGLATFSTKAKAVTGTSIDISQNYPCILDISIDEGSDVQTQSTVMATVRNATAPFDIHADFTALSNNPVMYDVLPDYSSPGSISATNWTVPNSNTVRWTNITHPTIPSARVVILSFWVINTENNMQFFTSWTFSRQNLNAWN